MLKSPKHRRNDPALRADNDGASGFAELPATELEQVLGQLAASAQEALGAQGRLRALLRATAAVADDLSLPVVLQRVVAAARELVDARYAALGVIGRNGELEQFVHAGMDAATVERVGPLPRGGGVLGLLISDPSPLRLTEMSAHPATVGFPPHHPPMGSFLGVPISVRGQIYGNLYLTESRRGEFSVEDERLITALAGSAGVAIANARLHQDSVQQRQWLAASTELTQRLFAGQLVEPVTAVLQHAVQGAGADMALLVMATGEERARVAAAVGGELAHLVGRDIELGDNLAGQVITTGKAILVEEDPQLDSVEFADLPGPIGAAIGVPLLDGDERVLGALIVAREPLRSAFTAADRDQIAAFASHAGIALELDRGRRARDSSRQATDRGRIATELHQHVIKSLFATGIGIQGMIARTDNVADQQRLRSYSDALDDTISRIRATIFHLQQTESAKGPEIGPDAGSTPDGA